MDINQSSAPHYPGEVNFFKNRNVTSGKISPLQKPQRNPHLPPPIISGKNSPCHRPQRYPLSDFDAIWFWAHYV